MKIFLKVIYNTCFYVLSVIIPKNKKWIIVGGWFGKRFGDNSRYFYLLNQQNQYGYRVIYVSDDIELIDELKQAGLEVVKKKSLHSIWLHLRSKYHVIDQHTGDILGSLSGAAIRIHLWHGIPMKKIWTDVPVYQNKFVSKLNEWGLLIHGRWNLHNLVVPSDFSKTIFEKCIKNPKIKIIKCKYPRIEYLSSNNDFLLKSEQENISIIEKQKVSGKKILLYLPTFRDTSNTLAFGCQNIEELNTFLDQLEKNNIYVVAKLHFADTTSIKIEHANCLFLNAKVDVYTIYNYSDILVTDYSSAMFDYLGLHKTIVYYPYDYEYYVNKDRGLLLDYDEFTPGLKAYSIKQLVDILRLDDNQLRGQFAIKQQEIYQQLYDQEYPTLLELINEGRI